MQGSAAIRRTRLIDLNLLPAELRPHRYPRWYVLGLAVVLTGCVLLVPMLALQHSAVQETSSLRNQLGVITAQLQSAGVDIGQERGLNRKIVEAEQALAALEDERAALPGASGPLAEDLSVLYFDAPAGMSIKSATRAGQDITVSGESSSIESVIAYATALRKSGAFDEVTIIKATGAGTSLEFSVQVRQ